MKPNKNSNPITMKTKKLVLATLMIAAFSLSAFKVFNSEVLPKGWIKAGDHPMSYEVGTTTDAGRTGKVGYIKSIEKKIKGFGTLMQMIIPNTYMGKRVKMSAFIKTVDVKEWVGLWMRVDGQKDDCLGFDNMQERPIKGTTAWKQYEIVLDIPNDTKALAYGVLVSGTGSALIDDIKFEVVDQNTPTTNIMTAEKNKYPSDPVNINFEE